ncbi:hypothetical protein [Flavobacterium sp.]|uniref:hypothetical protein n=1 Tax=Flavobacterium sp. TaxID=239 RepID=UPI0022C1006D|nr:hypothetical protein [Flavobacterium sp.]MCZ8089032.1 hypothetical protein [Flavobacterium sp.]
MNYIERLKKFSEKYKKVLFSIIVLLIIIPIGLQYLYYKEIFENKLSTKGTIIGMEETIRDYTLIYEYNVNGKKYLGSVSVSNFTGRNGKKCCVNCDFKVFYSSKSNEKSVIYLGDYEKYKRTVEFFDW